MKKLLFIGWLYLTAALGFLHLADDLSRAWPYWTDGASGLMESVDPQLMRWSKYGDPKGPVRVRVTYVTAGNRIDVDKYVAADQARRLLRGERIPVRFVKDDPRTARVGDDLLEMRWG